MPEQVLPRWPGVEWYDNLRVIMQKLSCPAHTDIHHIVGAGSGECCRANFIALYGRLTYTTSLLQDQETTAEQISMHCVEEQPVISYSIALTRAAIAASTFSFLL